MDFLEYACVAMGGENPPGFPFAQRHHQGPEATVQRAKVAAELLNIPVEQLHFSIDSRRLEDSATRAAI